VSFDDFGFGLGFALIFLWFFIEFSGLALSLSNLIADSARNTILKAA